MKERLIIIFVAIIAGLFITSAGFFIYQSTKTQDDTPITQQSQANNEEEKKEDPNTLFVKVLEPKDESLTIKRSLTIRGNTNPNNVIVISSNIEDVEVVPTQEGDFTASIDIDAGANPLVTRAIAPDGSWVSDIRTVTYSTEEF